MIISVASGKGGTGKTTIATNLSASLGKNVKILDCDVEEPNSHLFLNPKIEKTETIFTEVPEIDEDKCSYCNKCVEMCRYQSIAIIGKTILTFPELCHSCGGCMAVCPENAITWKGREIGETAIGKSGAIEFIHGKLRVGEAMSPPLIEKVRSYIDPDIINIIDAPPGTSCPVIAAMKNTDFVLMVTEPTPFGLHDLKLGVEAVKLLNIPCGLVINRADIGNNDVRVYAEKENLPILLELPFERKIAEVYSKGELIVEKIPEWKEKFLGLYRAIEKIVNKGQNK
jgi:MinD superfamily P-loop ATPase